MSKELALIVDGRVDELAERIDALEAKLEKRLAALERLMDLIPQLLIDLFTDAQAALRDS